MKIAIVTDSGSGLTKQQAGELGIYYLPLQIIIQDKMFLDGENITVEEIYEYLRNGEMRQPPCLLWDLWRSCLYSLRQRAMKRSLQFR